MNLVFVQSLIRDRFLHLLLIIGVVLSFFVPFAPAAWLHAIDWHTIITLSGLMLLTKGIELSGYFDVIGRKMARRFVTERQLAEIALSSAETAQIYGIEPRVALLSYSTGTSGSGEDVDKVVEATAIARQLMTERGLDFPLEGPLQYDAAFDPEVAALKSPGSTVAGRATVFIFPDLNTGNNTYKAVQRAANAVAMGPVLQGLNKPVNDLSRGCTVKDIVDTVALTAIQAQQLK